MYSIDMTQVKPQARFLPFSRARSLILVRAPFPEQWLSVEPSKTLLCFIFLGALIFILFILPSLVYSTKYTWKTREGPLFSSQQLPTLLFIRLQKCTTSIPGSFPTRPQETERERTLRRRQQTYTRRRLFWFFPLLRLCTLKWKQRRSPLELNCSK